MNTVTQWPEWQPIETAPMNGVEILGYWSSVSVYHMCVVRYIASDSEWYSESMAVMSPDYWLPLPPPPKA